MLHPDQPAKCCSYCGGRDHEFEACPKRKADAEKEKPLRQPEPAGLLQADLSTANLPGQSSEPGALVSRPCADRRSSASASRDLGRGKR